METDTHRHNTPPAAAAGTWSIGDWHIRRLGFGAMRLTGMPWDAVARDRDTAIAVLRRAVEHGVNHIDTAAYYFVPTRSANEIISTALHPYTGELTIATKVGAARARVGEFEAYGRPEDLRAQVEENIRQLGVDQLDLVYLRWGEGVGKQDGSVAEHVGALAELQDAGHVVHIGVSNVSRVQLMEAMGEAPIVAVQNRYGLTDREDDDILELTADNGIAFVPFFSMGAAIPGAGPIAAEHTGEETVAAIARAHAATPAQIRLAWTLHRGPNVIAIPGTGDLDHLDQNIAAARIRLDEEELARLNAVAG